MTASLVLADGTVVEGKRLGAEGLTTGEVVFNTGMTGYQEILTDPSYAGQIVLFTYPLIGNYGINDDDFESDRIQPTGIIVREACEQPSNWRNKKTIDQLLKERDIVGIQGVDTRMLTKRIRSAGVTMGAITTDDPKKALAKLKKSKSYDEQNFVLQVTTKKPYGWGYGGREEVKPNKEDKYKATIVALDCGLKFNILRRFAAINVRSIVLPATATADEVLSYKPSGVLLSPGPGDPEQLDQVTETVKNLIGQRPLFGICLGNQMLCRAVGGKTYKLKFGHRGSNHPVKDLTDGTVTITSQNHGYAVDPQSLTGTAATVTQLNVNDGTVEGIEIKGQDAWSIQYHPEAAPGPWDSRKHFARFLERISAK